MASSIVRKRHRPKNTSKYPRARTVIELSGDSDSPPPKKHKSKSTTPVLANGIRTAQTEPDLPNQQQPDVSVNVAKAASTASSEDGSTAAASHQSRGVSTTLRQPHFPPYGALEERTEQNLLKKSPFQNVPTWSVVNRHGSSSFANLNQGFKANSLERTIQSQKQEPQGGSTLTPTPQDVRQSLLASSIPKAKQQESRNWASRPVSEPEDQEESDHDGQILKTLTKPISRLDHRPEDPSSKLRTLDEDTLSANPLQQSQGLSVPHRPSASPASAAKVNQPPFSSFRGPANFTLEVPLSRDLAPLQLRPDYKDKRKKLFKELKKSTRPAVERLTEVEQYFGQNGFSGAFSTGDSGRLTKAASEKQRIIDRSKAQLDWGDPDPAPLLDEDVFDMSSLIHPIEQVKAVLISRFNEQNDPPVTFANDMNDRRLNGKFQFVNQYIIQPGVKLADPRNDFGCDCPGGCHQSECRCLSKDDKHGPPLQIQTYTKNEEANKVVLSEAYLVNELDLATANFEVTECNDCCKCGPECWNRVVERGRTVPLEIFETAKCGFGVRSSEKIVRGQFIEVYLGEVITQTELERRENAKEEGASSYIFSLDFFKAPGHECYHIDGENFGTAMRFVNHSCNPNARSFTVVRQKNDKNVHYVAFFAIRDIKADEEISIDYQNAGQVDVEEAEDEEVKTADSPGVTGPNEDDDGRSRCYCEAANCRKWLWPQKVRKRKKRKTTKHD